MVLFLFVVMMMDIGAEGLRQGFWKHFPIAVVLGVLIALEMSAVLMGGFRIREEPKTVSALGLGAGEYSNTRELGKLLYTEYVYPLEIAAAILLVAMIAAIALTLRRRKDSKFVSPSDQVRVRPDQRLTVLSMKATQPAPATDAVPASAETKP